MQKLRNQILLLIIGMAAGLLLISQYQAEPFTPTTEKFDEINDQNEILNNLNQEQSALKNQLTLLREDLYKLQSQSAGIGELQKEQEEELKARVGLTALAGSGIRITLDDSPAVVRENLDINNDALVHASDLRDIINMLRVYQAEAIAINGQRILVNSPVACVGNSILVNNSHLLPPFQIDAIGDSAVLAMQLKQNLSSLNQRMLDYGIIFQVAPQNNLTIPLFNGDLTFNYARLAE